MFLVYAAVAVVTTVVVFGLVLPRAMRRENSGGIALALAIVGALMAPGFFTGWPPALAAGGALLGWAGTDVAEGRRLSWAAFIVGVLGVVFNIASYVVVFI